MFVECHLHAGNAFDNSINMLQCVITIHDTERIKQTPALLSLAEKKKGKKTPRCSLSLFSPSLTSLSVSLSVFVQSVCAFLCAPAIPVVPSTGFAYKIATYFSQR